MPSLKYGLIKSKDIYNLLRFLFFMFVCICKCVFLEVKLWCVIPWSWSYREL